jgi:hypothetical protein
MTTDFSWLPEDESGSFEAFERWARPLAGVRIDGDYLCMEYRKPFFEGRGPVELGAADFRMLTEFVDLSQGDCATDGRLIRFASRYGGLGLCKQHGWPFAHTRPHCASDRLSENELGVSYREPIKGWKNFTIFASIILSALLARRRGASEAKFLELLKLGGDNNANQAIWRWFRGGEFHLNFMNRSRLSLYGSPPLWMAIGLELAMVATGVGGIILCSVCGRFDTVKRPQRNADRRSYCSKHRDRGRKRLAAADARQRQRRALGLHAEGKSIGEIADELGIARLRIKRYLMKGK